MTLSPNLYVRLEAFAALMIPGDEGAPGWLEIGLGLREVAHVLDVEPRWRAPLKRFLSHGGPLSSLADVEAIAQTDREGFQALGVVLANTYFMNPRTRAAIGYPGQEARDSSVGLLQADEALVAQVIARGPIFRQV